MKSIFFPFIIIFSEAKTFSNVFSVELFFFVAFQKHRHKNLWWDVFFSLFHPRCECMTRTNFWGGKNLLMIRSESGVVPGWCSVEGKLRGKSGLRSLFVCRHYRRSARAVENVFEFLPYFLLFPMSTHYLNVNFIFQAVDGQMSNQIFFKAKLFAAIRLIDTVCVHNKKKAFPTMNFGVHKAIRVPFLIFNRIW